MSELRIDDEILAGLELARDQLDALVEEGDRCRLGADPGLPEPGPRCEHCGHPLSDETIKDAIRTVLRTWALFPFDVALAAIRGREDAGERAYLNAVSRGAATTGSSPKQVERRRAIAA